jgi:hypothetical protein
MDLQLVNNGGVGDLGAATQVLQNPGSESLLNSGVSDPNSPDSRFQATVTGPRELWNVTGKFSDQML